MRMRTAVRGIEAASPQSRSRRTALGIALVAILCTLAPGCRAIIGSFPSNVRAAGVADRFAQALWQRGDEQTLDRLTSFRLKTMMRTNQLTALRDGHVRDYGEVRRLGPAWYEDSVISYRRFRVPIEFERTTIDMRIVIDEGQQVSQIFMVDHIPAP